MKPIIAQRGSGRGPLVIAFHVGAKVLADGLTAAGMADATAAVFVAESYAPLPAWGAILQDLADRTGWLGGPVVLAGWSMGAGAVNSLLRAGARPEVTICLDGGVGGDMPPNAAVVRAWREAAERARSGDGLLVLSHIYQTYTEGLPGASSYPSTVRIVREATGLELPEPTAAESPREHRDRGLVVLSWQSAAIDGKAHSAQQEVALPLILARYVAPHLAPYRLPEPRRDGTGEAALEVAVSLLGMGEEPPGSNAGPFVRKCFAGAVRGDRNGDGVEDPIGLTSGEWCAAFVGLCDYRAGVPRIWRCSVAELCADARKAGTLRSMVDYDPQPGDLAVFGRNGQDPRLGGVGHVAFFEQREDAEHFASVDGNHGTKVARVAGRRFDARELVGWIKSPRRP